MGQCGGRRYRLALEIGILTILPRDPTLSAWLEHASPGL